MKTPFDYRHDLNYMATVLGVTEIANKVLNNLNFLNQTASLHNVAHHNGRGGLLQHTWEVCSLVLQTASFFSDAHDIDKRELFLSALFHDYGKIWDYEYDEKTRAYVDTESKHRRRIHHIQRGAIEWEKIALELNVDPVFTERVTHNILSHHGQRDFGSPVMPYSREAWILHLCDNLSARVDDCDRFDMLNVSKRK